MANCQWGKCCRLAISVAKKVAFSGARASRLFFREPCGRDALAPVPGRPSIALVLLESFEKSTSMARAVKTPSLK